jgi:hypothetical protein
MSEKPGRKPNQANTLTSFGATLEGNMITLDI